MSHSSTALPCLQLADAEIIHQGAHLIRFKDWLYLSPNALFQEGKAIRGGIPVIFPWFGPNAKFPEAPAHGFARTNPWQLEKADDAGAIFTLDNSIATSPFWPYAYSARLEFEFGDQLNIRFHLRNRDTQPFSFEFALHTYFAVSNVENVSVEGLDGKTYIDKTQIGARLEQHGAVTFTGETDRVYLNSGGPVEIRENGEVLFRLQNHGGWLSTVVWNPWPKKAAQQTDLGVTEWPKFVCVETGVIADNAPLLEPGSNYELDVSISR